jgi:GNAT superfamily N-acetyltransferase
MNLKTIEQVDIERVAYLFDQYRQFYRRPPDIRAALAFMRDRVRKRDSLIAVMECGEVLAGLIQVYPTLSSITVSDVWVINDLYVEPAYRGRGIAGELIGWVHATAKTVGIGQIRISTEISNVVAQKLYESIGYTADTRFKHYVATLQAAPG